MLITKNTTRFSAEIKFGQLVRSGRRDQMTVLLFTDQRLFETRVLMVFGMSFFCEHQRRES
jgi:hypothetical protein